MTTEDTKPSRLSRREALRTGAQAGLAALTVGAGAGNAEAQIETGPLSTRQETITLVAVGREPSRRKPNNRFALRS